MFVVHVCYLTIFVFTYKHRFQSKPKQRRDLLKEHVSQWFRKNSGDVYFPQLQTTASFWGIKDAAKEERKLEFGRYILTKWYGTSGPY